MKVITSRPRPNRPPPVTERPLEEVLDDVLACLIRRHYQNIKVWDGWLVARFERLCGWMHCTAIEMGCMAALSPAQTRAAIKRGYFRGPESVTFATIEAVYLEIRQQRKWEPIIPLQLMKCHDNHEHEHHRHHHGRVVDGIMTFRPLTAAETSATSARKEVSKMNNTAYQLIAAALATLVWDDGAGKVISPPAGSTVVWSSSNPAFATVTPQGDGLSSAIVAPVDTTGATPGAAVITATLTQPDGKIVIVTGAVANTDDVTVGSMSFGPVPTPPPAP